MSDTRNRDSESTARRIAVTYFPMFIATLSLVTSIYNGYLNGKFVDLIQHNVARTEHMRSCKEIIDAYFQVKLRVGIVADNGARERATKVPIAGAEAARVEAANAVSKLAALGTYLANLHDEATRERYTHLSWELEEIVREAPELAPSEVSKRFEKANKMFSAMNDDCVKTAKQ
jgi:hypothetical protein